MSPLRPDLVACWLYRIGAGDADDAGDAGGAGLQILLLRRAPGRMFAGLWQCVTGSLEAGERIIAGALREVEEETGLRPADLRDLAETDLVNWFHVAAVDAMLSEAVFAARVAPGATITLSAEHDDLRWATPAEAHALVVWPAYHEAIERVEWLVANPDRSDAYRLPDPGLPDPGGAR